jgi:hypothetical protein
LIKVVFEITTMHWHSMDYILNGILHKIKKCFYFCGGEEGKEWVYTRKMIMDR